LQGHAKSRRFAVAIAACLFLSSIGPPARCDNAGSMQAAPGFLSPQQRAMLMMEKGLRWRTMSQEDRQAARETMRTEWLAMSPADREAKRAELQARWDALPALQKELIESRLQKWRAHRDGR
jgi:hypothetical protein